MESHVGRELSSEVIRIYAGFVLYRHKASPCQDRQNTFCEKLLKSIICNTVDML